MTTRARLLVLGANGMLGHKLMQVLAEDLDPYGTIRAQAVDGALGRFVDPSRIFGGVCVEDIRTVRDAISEIRPAIVLNCIGIVKQRKEASDAIPTITVNSLFPHRLAKLSMEFGFRLIHFSTDCVFSGDRGDYSESDRPDSCDLYGRTKLLGEVAGPGCLTVRSSIIGHELGGHMGLIDWFLSQKGGQIRGFAKAFYSGLTTYAMSKLVKKILLERPDLHGVWHVASDRISKCELLAKVNLAYELGITIERDESFHCDRTLNDDQFRLQTLSHREGWNHMIGEMHLDWLNRRYRLEGQAAHA